MNRKVMFIRNGQVFVLAIGICVILSLTFLLQKSKAVPADAMPVSERVIHMVTGEYKTTTKDGKEIEAYRWDPGTVFVNKGENVKLVLLGINGDSHPFIIEGMHIQGTVTKGEETIVNFHASKEGIFRIICIAHPDAANNGPMIGYIIVD